MSNSCTPYACEPLFDGVGNYTLPDPAAKLPLERTARLQYFQNQCSGLGHAYEAYYRPFPDPSDQTHANIWKIPNNSLVQNNPTLCGPVSAMDQPIAPNIIWHRNGLYEDGLITEQYATLRAPIMPRITLSRTEFYDTQTHRVDHSPQHLSIPHYQPTVIPYPSPLSPGSDLPSPGTSSQPVAVSRRRSSQECYDLWKKVPVEAIIVTGSDKFVPQTFYMPLTKADKERYLELVQLSPPILFLTKEPFEWGIPLEDVRNRKVQRLMNKDDPVLENCGPSASIRINWPGYYPFKRSISSRNWRKTKGPITREKLARNLAEVTNQFIKEMSHKPMEVDADSNWRVGIQHIKVEDLILVSLHHVSKGSWQPQFRLRREL